MTYDGLLGVGLTEGAGVGLGLGDGVGVGTGDSTTAVLTSLGASDGKDFSDLAEFPGMKNVQRKIPAARTISIIKISLIGRYFKINILGQQR